MKECPRHGLTEHFVQKNGTPRCKKCRMMYMDETRERNKRYLLDLKGGKCEICGYDECVDALEFHHINPNDKSFNIGDKLLWNREKLAEEAKKCMLLCCNCHRELHSK